MKSIFAKVLNDEEIKKIILLKDVEFKSFINNKFYEKRNNRIKLFGEKNNLDLEKRIFLQLVDQNWKTHLQYLENLRQVIGLRSYGQRDPLIEYKKEAFNLFENLLVKLKTDLIRILINLEVVEKKDQEKEEKGKIENNFQKLASKKIGRNEPCPCNSGKKYKN